jgi:UDP-glucose 4-epimerase
MAAKKTASQKRPAIAITGINGFLGGALLHLLEGMKEYPRVIAIDQRKPTMSIKKAKFFRMDLTETLADEKLAEIFKNEGVQEVIHAAFPISPPHNGNFAHELQSIGTMYVLNACAHQKIKKLILTSTTDVYGARASNPNYLSEDHQTRGGEGSRFIRDKVDAEQQALRFAKYHSDCVVTILRPCTILGPKIRNFKTTFLQRPAVFTVMGYDPLMQFVHEDDVLNAFEAVLKGDHPGVYNIVGEGVLPMSRVLQLTGKIGIPVPAPILYPIAHLMWYTDLFPAPASHLDFLKYLCVADGRKAARELAFKPKFNSRETLLSFIGAERLRRMHLLDENYENRTNE